MGVIVYRCKCSHVGMYWLAYALGCECMGVIVCKCKCAHVGMYWLVYALGIVHIGVSVGRSVNEST